MPSGQYLVQPHPRFLPAAARTLQLLTGALKGNPKVLEWSPAMQESFTAIKAALVDTVPLAHPLPHSELLWRLTLWTPPLGVSCSSER